MSLSVGQRRAAVRSHEEKDITGMSHRLSILQIETELNSGLVRESTNEER